MGRITYINTVMGLNAKLAAAEQAAEQQFDEGLTIEIIPGERDVGNRERNREVGSPPTMQPQTPELLGPAATPEVVPMTNLSF